MGTGSAPFVRNISKKIIVLTLVFLAVFFGSMHCVGLRGAMVAAYSTQDQFHVRSVAGKWNPFFKHHAYNFGRLLSYVFVGAILGSAGGGFSGLKSIGAWFPTAAWFLLFAAGVWMLRIIPLMGFKSELPILTKKKPSLLNLNSKTYGVLLSSPTDKIKFYIGFLTPLLPCGLLYSAFLIAAASGSALNGALAMALFGIGIVPSLVIVGFFRHFFDSDYARGETSLQPLQLS